MHSKFLELAGVYRDAAADMLAGAESGDAARFRKGHELLFEATERYTRWDQSLMGLCREHGVKPAPFPELPALPTPCA